MNSFTRIASLAAAVAAALCPLGVSARAANLLPGDAALRARYALPASKFTTVDGESIHYVDQGQGPTIVLVHGSYASLRQWDGWARTLSRRYRVIRFDLSPAGLSGPNPKGDYSPERKIEIIDHLTTQLGAQRFFLVATSSGGVAGAGFAAEHPDRVRGLVLNNVAAGAIVMDTTSFSPAFKQVLAQEAGNKGAHPPEFWRQILLHNFVDDRKVTPALVREWTELNSRGHRMPPAPGATTPASALGRSPGDLARITVPTLLLWSAEDQETTLDRDGRAALALLPAQDKALVVVPACGHMAPIECSDRSVALAKPFFDRLTTASR